MALRNTDQLTALQRIATFSAAVRGHALGEWQVGDNLARAKCIRCSAELRVYFPTLQPEMDGSALDRECRQETASRQAA